MAPAAPNAPKSDAGTVPDPAAKDAPAPPTATPHPKVDAPKSEQKASAKPRGKQNQHAVRRVRLNAHVLGGAPGDEVEHDNDEELAQLLAAQLVTDLETDQGDDEDADEG